MEFKKPRTPHGNARNYWTERKIEESILTVWVKLSKCDVSLETKLKFPKHFKHLFRKGDLKVWTNSI